MKNYAEMSDFEINKEVASKLYDEDWWHKNGKVLINRQGTDVFGDKFSGKVEVDYCNNPSDTWPIIFENGISICSPEHCLTPCEWWAEKFLSCDKNKSLNYKDKNPLRAAMIVYLMLKDSEQ